MPDESKEGKFNEFSSKDMKINFENLVSLIETNFRLLDLRFDDIYKRFEQIDKRFEQIDKRFEQMDKRFEQMDKRFEQIDKRFEQIDKRFEQMDKRFEQIDKRFEEIDKRFIELEQRLEQKIDKQADDIFDTINRMVGNVQTEMREGFAKIDQRLDEFSAFKESTCFRLQNLERDKFTDCYAVRKPSLSQSCVKERIEEHKKRRQQKP